MEAERGMRGPELLKTVKDCMIKGAACASGGLCGWQRFIWCPSYTAKYSSMTID